MDSMVQVLDVVRVPFCLGTASAMPVITMDVWAVITVMFTCGGIVVSTAEIRFPYKAHQGKPRHGLDIVRVMRFFNVILRLEDLTPHYLDQVSWSRLRGQFDSYPVAWISWSSVLEEEAVDEGFGKLNIRAIPDLPHLEDAVGDEESECDSCGFG